ncbi:MAG: hypothetical protein M1839_006859 [Geoglossum umbratile]|nr:MAG: hypothetical protein M1839_006859 [Geoglossum umbratile]
MSTPRVFVIRHGETEWSLNGRHTSTTELSLTPNGERRIRATGRALVGNDRLLVPGKIAHIYVSPRHRARQTLELLGLNLTNPLPWSLCSSNPSQSSPQSCPANTTITPLIREWDYGDYEGLTSPQIRALRASKGIVGKGARWDIWRDGCEGGESPREVEERVDTLIKEIRGRWHGGEGEKTGDVLVVGHGHILRAFAMRWVGKKLDEGPAFLLEAGGVGTLSYEHHNIEEPAILLGGAFVVSAAESEAEDPKDKV